ncbi:MAG TPA: hypothetical protein VGM33_18185 [Baekduia sp.]
MTPDTRHRAPFELLRFTAAAVSADVGIVELEGRFPASSRFSRQPVLVVEDGAGPRTELAPAHAVRDGDRWIATFAVPLAALDTGTFALGLRGTLLDLPAPDLADDGDRLASVAREANALRRLLEAAEDAGAAARAEALATAGELGAAVTAARDEAETAAAARIAALEQAHADALAQAAERVATLEQAHADALAQATERVAAVEDELAATRALAAEEREEARLRTAQEVEAVRAEVASGQEAAYAAASTRADEAEIRADESATRALAAEERAAAAEARATAAENDASAVTDAREEEAEARAEAAEERANEAEARAAAAEATLAAAVGSGDAGPRDAADPTGDAEDAALRTGEHDAFAVPDEREGEAHVRADGVVGRTAEAAPASADDARAAAAHTEQRLRTAQEAADAGIAVLRAELAEERERSQTTIADLQAQLDAARSGQDPTAVHAPVTDTDPAATHVLRPAAPEAPMTLKVTDTPPASATPREAVTHHAPGPTPSRWFAVAALALFLFVLLGLLLGFLP